MKIEEIKTIIKLMAENDLTEFKIEAEDMHLCLKRGNSGAAGQIIQPAVAPAIVAAAPAIQASSAAVVSAAESSAAKAAVPEKPKATIDAPIVGTFYSAKSPDSAPFVQVGTQVTADTVVCIIEAMKVMNDIKAEKSGTIKEILAKNGQTVEYGQPLFVIE